MKYGADIYIARISLRLQMAEKKGGGHNVPPPRSWRM